MSRATFAKTVLGGSFGYPYTIDEECNADSHRQKGDDHLQTGMDAAALAAFERSMRCRPDPTLVPKAFLAACRLKNQGKAKHYYPMLPESKRALAHVCIRNGIQVGDDTQALTSECDAAALTQKGDDHLQTGMDAAALAAFEKSYACKADPALHRKLLLSACRAKKGAAAQKYYMMLPSRDRSALAQMCIRNGVPLDENAALALGVIKIASTPAAKIWLDGIDTGKTTPVTLKAMAGKHKITFVLGADKYTYAVTVKEGETTSLTKELQ